MSTEESTSVPEGYCQCGCGEYIGYWTKTDRSSGRVKGEPKRHAPGHAKRITRKRADIEPINPSGLCKCGCGEPAPLAKQTHLERGYICGEPMEYILGHSSRLKDQEYLTPAKYQQWWAENAPSGVPYGFCFCGCGQRTTIAAQTDSKHFYVGGEPKQWLLGHKNARPISSSDYVLMDRGYETPCWIWQRHVNQTGYAVLNDRARGGACPTLAHRAMFRLHRGQIPEGEQLDHLCRQTDCVNPWHLEPVTCAVNIQRGKVAKLTPEKVREMRARHAKGESMNSLAKIYEVSPETVRDACQYRTWRNV